MAIKKNKLKNQNKIVEWNYTKLSSDNFPWYDIPCLLLFLFGNEHAFTPSSWKPSLDRLAWFQLKALTAPLEPSTDLLSHQSSYEDVFVLDVKKKKKIQHQVVVYIPMGTFQVIGGKKHKSRSSEVSWVLCVSLKGDVPAGCGARPCSVPGLGGSRGSWAARSPPSTAHVVVLVSRLCSFLHQPAASNWVNYILPTFFLLFRNKQTPKQKNRT